MQSRGRGLATRARWLLSLVLILALIGCEGGSTVTMHGKTCRGAGSAGHCEGRFGSLSGTYPEEIGSVTGDAVDVRAEVSVQRGQVTVSVESPAGDIASITATPQKPALLEGIAEVDFDAFEVTFDAAGGKASGISYVIEYGPVSPDGVGSRRASDAPTADLDEAAGDRRAANVSLVDLLALAHAPDSCSYFTVMDFEALRAATGAPVPPAGASNTELVEHLQTLSPGLLYGPKALLDITGERSVLLPLVRSSAYIAEFRYSMTGTEVYVGDFAPDAFGQPAPDAEVRGVDTVQIAPPYGLSEAAERLTVGDGTVTVASTPDAISATLDARRGDRHTLAVLPRAAEVVSTLDDLGVVSATFQRLGLSQLIDAHAIGLAADPDNPGSWLLVVLYHPRAGDELDIVTTKLAEKADAYAEQNGAEVVDVTTRDGLALATIRTNGSVNSARVELTLSPSEWDTRYQGQNPCSSLGTKGRAHNG